MTDNVQLIASTNISVSLDGVPQAQVVAFNTRGGWVCRYVRDDEGTWGYKEFNGVVSASCDFTTASGPLNQLGPINSPDA